MWSRNERGYWWEDQSDRPAAPWIVATIRRESGKDGGVSGGLASRAIEYVNCPGGLWRVLICVLESAIWARRFLQDRCLLVADTLSLCLIDHSILHRALDDHHCQIAT